MRFYGFAPALLAAVWLSFTPWLPRSLLWTCVDGVAIAYLVVGAAFLLGPTRRPLACHMAAGAAIAVNCNLFVLTICWLLGPGWAFFYRREGICWLARAILALAVGFFCHLSRLGTSSLRAISGLWIFSRTRNNSRSNAAVGWGGAELV